MKKSHLALAVKSALAASLAVSVTANTAVAQTDDNPRVVEEVFVTGSRIQRPNLVSSTPVNIIDNEAIEISGAINTVELIEALPASGVATFASTTSNFGTQNSGVNTVELRNLGEDRTLVLVNGRRFVGGVPGSQIVDFNTIPTEFIERIDVLTGGASAIYGSDALAGVVNIVLKENFEGFQVSGQGGITAEDDDETYRLSMTGGFTFDDDRGSAMVSATWDKENGVFARNRENLGVDGANSVFFTGDPNDFDQAVVPFFSSFSERGRFIVPNRSVESGSADLVIGDDGQVTPFVSAEHGFNRQAFRALSVPTERLQVSGILNYNIADNFAWFMESSYSRAETNSRLEPFPFGSDDVYGEQAQCADTDGDEALDQCRFGIPALNPLVPQGILDAARDAVTAEGVQTVADEDLVIGFARRTTELGARGADNIRQTFRIVTGFKGSFLDDFNYELSLNHGQTTQDQKSSGQINVLNMRYALDAVVDPDTNEIVCRDEIARIQGCLPVNLFGLGSITANLDERERAQMLRYLQANSSRTAKLEQTIATGFISGPLFELPGGTAQFSVGAEYRDESSESIADGLSQQGLNAGNISPPTIGGFDVTEFFGELNLPIVSDVSGIKSLELDLAARASDYSTVGSTSAYATSLRYAPVEDVLIRTQYSRAVRAPNISELFQPLSETFEGGDDPCEGVTRDGSGNAAFLNTRRNPDDPSVALGSGVDAGTVGDSIAVACLQDPLVSQRVDRDGGLVLSQTEIQGVGGFNGGAAAGGTVLTEETADTITFGVVWNPAFLESFSLTVDYFDIEIDDAIASLDRQDSLDNCYVGAFDPSTDFCGNIVRFSSGPFLGALDELNALQQNIAQAETNGIDIQADYTFDFGDAGDLRTSLTWTHLLNYKEVPFEGADEIDFTGEVGFAENKAILGLIYGIGQAKVSLTTSWISASELSNDPDNAFFGASISDKFFFDLQSRYSVTEGIELVLGIDNVTDEFVRIEQFGPDVPTGWNTRPDVYDALGRRYYAGFKAKF